MKKILCLFLLFILQSCGTKGSLYLPEELYPLDDSQSNQRPAGEELDDSSGTLDE
jgi:predicted small lipoprotein YifL